MAKKIVIICSKNEEGINKSLDLFFNNPSFRKNGDSKSPIIFYSGWAPEYRKLSFRRVIQPVLISELSKRYLTDVEHCILCVGSISIDLGFLKLFHNVIKSATNSKNLNSTNIISFTNDIESNIEEWAEENDIKIHIVNDSNPEENHTEVLNRILANIKNNY